MWSLVIRWIAVGLLLIGLSGLGIGVSLDGIEPAMVAAAILLLAYTLARPVLTLAFPLNMLTLGFFSVAFHALLLYGVTFLVPGFSITGPGGALFTAFLIGLMTTLLGRSRRR